MITREQLEAVAGREILPELAKPHSQGKPFDLPGFFTRHGLEVRSQGPWQDGTCYELSVCPFNSEHRGTAHVEQFASGAISAGCHHASCTWNWTELRARFEPRPAAPAFSDDATALEFTADLGADLRYAPELGRWYHWDGQRWEEDRKLFAFTKARETCRAAAAHAAAEPEKARRLASSATVASVERLARLDPCHITGAEEWDGNAWLLNTAAGTVDLHTGQLRPHRREDLITKIIPISPGGDCPLWLQFLARITDYGLELERFLQRMVGYCLTGSTREHGLFFLYGLGANGKTVFQNTVENLLGPYSRTAPTAMLLSSRFSGERHPSDMAGLRGARLVTAGEVAKGSRWDEAKIKMLTGGDRITARFMRQDFFEYTPQFKLLIAGNHRPGLRSVDEAIRRRFNLIPFTVTIPPAERDPDLCEKLKAEYPGILAWAIEGCLQWQREGLNPPAVVRVATTDYFGEEDALGRWITELCVLGVQEKASSNALFTSWREWAERAGEFAGSQKNFVQSLEARAGISRYRTEQVRGYRGIRLKTLEELRAAETAPTVKPNGRDQTPPVSIADRDDDVEFLQ